MSPSPRHITSTAQINDVFIPLVLGYRVYLIRHKDHVCATHTKANKSLNNLRKLYFKDITSRISEKLLKNLKVVFVLKTNQ